jgi:hypothetical protein
VKPQKRTVKGQNRVKMPTMADVFNAALDVVIEDLPAKLQSNSALAQTARFKDHLLDEPTKADASLDWQDMTCDEITNALILDLPSMGSVFYFLVNGWYLGQLGDYASCRVSTTEGQYLLATISGEYTGSFPFTRGTYGKYYTFSPQMGICVPK